MSDAEMSTAEARPGWVGGARLVVGLTQGLALYLLYSAMEDKSWPATDALVFAPLLFVSLYVPLVVLASLGNLRTTTLLIWAVVATVVVAGFGWYDVWHNTLGGRAIANTSPAVVTPSFGAFFFT